MSSRLESKNAKRDHREVKRLNPEGFEAKRQELGNEIITSIIKTQPKWGGVKFKYERP